MALRAVSAPHAEHSRVEGNHRSIATKSRPYRPLFASSVRRNIPHAASRTDFADRPRDNPDTDNDSTYAAWFSRMILVVA